MKAIRLFTAPSLLSVTSIIFTQENSHSLRFRFLTISYGRYSREGNQYVILLYLRRIY